MAIPLGGKRNAATAARLKAEGARAGVPDIFLPVARHGCHGLWIELKRSKTTKLSAKTGRTIVDKSEGKAQDHQTKWIADLQAEGYGACVCVGWEEARDVLIQYLNQ
jgi:hypothetical protein